MDLHQAKIPREFEGKTFLEVMEIFKERLDTIPVGIVRGNGITINPGKETKLEKGDEILYIAEEALNIGSLD
jgi:Trk K+ transport system NAD-binding subunit